MEPIDLEQARANLVALRLPRVVLDAFDGKPIPEPMKWRFRCPWEMLLDLTPEQQAEYPAGRVTPVWSDHTGGMVTAYRHDGARPGFLRFVLEQPDVEDESGLSWPQVLVRELTTMWEAEVDDEELEDIATQLGVAFFDPLIRELEENPRATEEEEQAWYRAFLARLPAHGADGGMP